MAVITANCCYRYKRAKCTKKQATEAAIRHKFKESELLQTVKISQF